MGKTFKDSGFKKDWRNKKFKKNFKKKPIPKSSPRPYDQDEQALEY